MGQIPLLRLFRRSDQPEVQQHTPVVDEPKVQPSLKPAPSGESNTRAIPQDVKIEVAVRDGGRCRQCGSNRELHFDHVIPWSKGGPNTVDNIQLLCDTCNRRKGTDDTPTNLPPSPYRQPWRSPVADARPSQPPGTYKSLPPLPYYVRPRPELGQISAQVGSHPVRSHPRPWLVAPIRGVQLAHSVCCAGVNPTRSTRRGHRRCLRRSSAPAAARRARRRARMLHGDRSAASSPWRALDVHVGLIVRHGEQPGTETLLPGVQHGPESHRPYMNSWTCAIFPPATR
jgi:hypothetical protein